MKRAERGTAALCLAALLAGSLSVRCGGSTAGGRAGDAPPVEARAASGWDWRAPMARYHSSRLGASIVLPDAARWRIDDHSRPVLEATDTADQSRVLLAVFRAAGLVGRAQCEALARAQKLVPDADLRTLEDDATVTQEAFDTRVWVAVDPPSEPGRPLSGYVMAFGGLLRKCYAFVFSTRVDSSAAEPLLSSRLAFARSRILAGLTLDVFGAVGRAEEAGPTRPTAP